MLILGDNAVAADLRAELQRRSIEVNVVPSTRDPAHYAHSMPSLLGPAQIRELAAHLDLTPTKKLGQNFVHDPNTVRRIVASAPR